MVVGLRTRLAGHHRPLDDVLLAPLDGLHAVEIGGPTERFRAGGTFPVYPRLAGCDCVQWRSDTAWHQLQEDMPFAPDGRAIGRLHVVAGDELAEIRDEPWDALISCHVIEHFANPYRALLSWRDAIRPGGALLIVAPHGAATFDHRRPATAVAHMLEDHERGTDETDLTHLAETLRLHDRRRDPVQADDATWEAERRDNANTRLLHHHVFHGGNLAELVGCAGFQLQWIRVRHPHDIVLMATRLPNEQDPDNSALLAPDAGWRRLSPHRVDRTT